MTSRARVAVIGSGVAGTASAWCIAKNGATATIVSQGAGASELCGGAVDDLPWEDRARAARISGSDLRAPRLGEGVAAFAEALDLWRLPPQGDPLPRLCTLAGRVRPARGHDRALLDLATLPSGAVALPRVDRAGWDADSLAACWNDDPFVRSRALRFVPIDAAILRYDGEDRIADADLAARHDDPARIAWLAARLREAFDRERLAPCAVLLGPWLGVDTPRAADLGAKLGLPAGEALAGSGSPAGLRFARARHRLLDRTNVRTVAGRVVRLTPPAPPAPATLTLRDAESVLRADRIVLACGGLLAGGIVFDPPDVHAGTDVPDRDAPAFRLSFDLDPTPDGRPYLAAFGARAGVASSIFGPDLERSAWPQPARPGLLEAIGVACDDAGLAAPYLAAAGDVMASRPRTTLAAVESGLRAAEWAAR